MQSIPGVTAGIGALPALPQTLPDHNLAGLPATARNPVLQAVRAAQEGKLALF
ncbi:hypothetical protein [Streptomyces sp. NPDC004726]